MSHSTTLKIQAELVEKYREEIAARESPAPARGIRKEEKEGDGGLSAKAIARRSENIGRCFHDALEAVREFVFGPR